MGFIEKVKLLAEFGKEQINVNYEIPYLAGYSKDGNTIYIDKRLPRQLELKDGRTIDVFKYLATHERVEKLLEDTKSYKYPYAHMKATDAERHAVIKDGIDWDEYQTYMLKMVKKLKNFSGELPKDLDLKPEKDTHNYYLYHKIRKLQGLEQ